MKGDRLMVLKDVAEHLRASVKTVRRRIAAGELRGFKEGGRVCVLESDLMEFLGRRIQATASR
jgi:excisionase family DNA binding protein